MESKNGYTLIELLVVIAICGIGVVIALSGLSGNSFIPNKQDCINAGGKWSEGIQYGRMTQLCTYN
jgi:prepilin-type N-terminal cleavage/methylation domain-containing protein